MIRALVAALALSFPIAASALPITIELDPGGSDSTTGVLGGTIGTSTGSLMGDLENEVMSGLHGEIFIRDVGRVSVLDGAFDFTGATDSWLATDRFGDFAVARTDWDGQRLIFLASNTQCGRLGCKTRWLRFRGQLDPSAQMPEPSAALLFGLGAVVVSRRIRSR